MNSMNTQSLIELCQSIPPMGVKVLLGGIKIQVSQFIDEIGVFDGETLCVSINFWEHFKAADECGRLALLDGLEIVHIPPMNSRQFYFRTQ